jgi:hypothetical protein
MQCILYKIYFWKVFHMYYNLICIFLYALLFAQNFILVKSGCYKNLANNNRLFWNQDKSGYRCLYQTLSVDYSG